MKIHFLAEAPSPKMARALAQFERQFRYPLGTGRFFRICHGADYSRFFRAMGKGASFIAERDGNILGTIGVARRALILPDGNLKNVVYIGDAKVSPEIRGGRVLWRLIQAVRAWTVRHADAAYSAVMEGTPIVPTRYTGQLGIEPFAKLAEVVILRIRAKKSAVSIRKDWKIDAAAGWNLYRKLTQGSARCIGGKPDMRSLAPPQWLAAPNGKAVGLLEDTRQAKRLLETPRPFPGAFSNGESLEMNVSHLSHCAWLEDGDGIALLQQALSHSTKYGFDAMFTAASFAAAETIVARFGAEELIRASAGIYGTGLDAGMIWKLNTSEI